MNRAAFLRAVVHKFMNRQVRLAIKDIDMKMERTDTDTDTLRFLFLFYCASVSLFMLMNAMTFS